MFDIGNISHLGSVEGLHPHVHPPLLVLESQEHHDKEDQKEDCDKGNHADN